MSKINLAPEPDDSREIGQRFAGPWVETFTGKYVNPLDLQPEDICIEDIAHALSLICGFNGHCKQFYSVGQHCLHVAYLLEGSGFELAGLLHDASEAYFGDIAKPVKIALRPAIEIIEERIQLVIFDWAGIAKSNWRPKVKRVDNLLLAMEARDLMHSKGKLWKLPRLTDDRSIIPESIEMIEKLYIQRFKGLCHATN